jgi:Ser/Thr protein kinase RdoA (MazF antagonist)
VAAAVAELNSVTRDLHLPHARSHTDWKRLERLEMTASRVSSPGLAEMAARAREFGQQFTERLASVGGNLPSGIVHHDANPGNALLDEDGKLTALLDFDEAHEGELVTDVASLLRLWATPRDWQGLKPEMTEAVLLAYNRRRPLSQAEWDVLPDFLLFFTLADAAEYVSRRLASDAPGAAVHECLAYQRFMDLQRDRKWMKMLLPP